MIRTYKLASIGIPLVLATVALSIYAYKHAHAAPTYTFANGVEVTPVEVQPDDVGKVLGIKVWKYDVSLPSAKQGLQLTLNLCRTGKIIHSVGGVGFLPMKGQSSDRHLLLTLVMAPDDGDFSRGKRVRYFLESQSGSTNGDFTNPLRGSAGLGLGPDDVSVVENSVYLIGGGRVGMFPVSLDDTALALTFTPEKPLQ